jgi:hypothetical protein
MNYQNSVPVNIIEIKYDTWTDNETLLTLIPEGGNCRLHLEKKNSKAFWRN